MGLVALLTLVLAWLSPGSALKVADYQPPSGLLGISCGQEVEPPAWMTEAEIERGAALRDICGGPNTVVLFPDALANRTLAINIIAHEAYHQQHGPVEDAKTVYGYNDEHAAYEAGCRFSWYEPYCPLWLAQ